MDAQEIFNKVALHLIKQGARSCKTSRQGKAICAYRGEGGLKCPVGLFIPDTLYSEKMEELHVKELYDKFPLLDPSIKKHAAMCQDPLGYRHV